MRFHGLGTRRRAQKTRFGAHLFRNRRREERHGSEGRTTIVSGAEAPAARLKDPPRRISSARPEQQLPPRAQAFSAATRGPARTQRAPAPPRLYAPACAPPLPPSLPLSLLSLSRGSRSSAGGGAGAWLRRPFLQSERERSVSPHPGLSRAQGEEGGAAPPDTPSGAGKGGKGSVKGK